MRVRPAAVAGTFYPDDPRVLAATVDRALAAAPAATAPPPKALVVPHAGYVYSGAVAATAYAQLAPVRHAIRRVVLLGPAHRVPLDGVAASSADAFETPLGLVPCDGEGRAAVLGLDGVTVDDGAHAGEHALEVQLPFLQRCLDAFALLPLVVGWARPEAVAAVLDAVWGGAETLVIVSSDLSHYHDHATARALDARTAAAVVAARAEALGPDDACGRHPLAGLLVAAHRRGLGVRLLDLRTSGDTNGGLDRVVGYGAFALG